MMTRTILTLLGVLLACSESTTSADNRDQLRVETAKAQYTPGETVHVTLTNISAAHLQYWACPIRLERRVGSGWAAVPFEAACAFIRIPLASGAHATVNAALPLDAPSGVYRLEFDVVDHDASLPRNERLSNEFEVG